MSHAGEDLELCANFDRRVRHACGGRCQIGKHQQSTGRRTNPEQFHAWNAVDFGKRGPEGCLWDGLNPIESAGTIPTIDLVGESRFLHDVRLAIAVAVDQERIPVTNAIHRSVRPRPILCTSQQPYFQTRDLVQRIRVRISVQVCYIERLPIDARLVRNHPNPLRLVGDLAVLFILEVSDADADAGLSATELCVLVLTADGDIQVVVAIHIT